MIEEIFDVVNESDEVIGQETRGKIHQLGLRHRAVHVLIFNQRGELFLQKRSLSKDCFPGKWDSSAAGHLDRGEEYDACAVREVREELGIQLNCAPKRLFKISACAETGQEFVWVYSCQHEGPFSLHPEEIELGEWVNPVRLEQWLQNSPEDFAPALPLIWRQFQTIIP